MKKTPATKMVHTGYYIPTIILFLFLLYVAALVFHYIRQASPDDGGSATGHSSISKAKTP